MRNDCLAYTQLSKPMTMLLTKQPCPFLSTVSTFLIIFWDWSMTCLWRTRNKHIFGYFYIEFMTPSQKPGTSQRLGMWHGKTQMDISLKTALGMLGDMHIDASQLGLVPTSLFSDSALPATLSVGPLLSTPSPLRTTTLPTSSMNHSANAPPVSASAPAPNDRIGSIFQSLVLAIECGNAYKRHVCKCLETTAKGSCNKSWWHFGWQTWGSNP